MSSILIVCTANVCRSPLAALRLSTALGLGAAPHPAESGAGLRVESAGSLAYAGSGICPSVLSRLDGASDEHVSGVRHGSRRLTKELLRNASLVLVPDFANRARVVALEPTARRRTFTLQEAALLAPSLDVPAAGLAIATPGDGLAVWADALHAARSWMRQPSQNGSRFNFRSRAVRGLEIADGHNLGARLHRETLDAVESAINSISASLANVMEARGSQ